MKRIRVTKKDIENIINDVSVSQRLIDKLRDELIVNTKDVFMRYYEISEDTYNKLFNKIGK